MLEGGMGLSLESLLVFLTDSKFPCRVLAQDQASNEFLGSILSELEFALHMPCGTFEG